MEPQNELDNSNLDSGFEESFPSIEDEDNSVVADDAGDNVEDEPQEEDAPVEEEPVDEDTAIAAVIEGDELNQLREQIAQLKQQMATQNKPFEPEKPIDFVTDEEFDAILQEPAKLNEKFNAIYKQARADAQKEISATVQQQFALQEMVRQFYVDNADLEPHRELVGKLSSEIMTRNPGITYPALLERVAKAARTVKKLPVPNKRGASKGQNAAKPPKLPTVNASAGRFTSKPPVDKVSSDIDDLLKVVDF